jgi:DDE_Tnp_1-associated
VDGPEAELLVALAGMADPRKRRGCRYWLAIVLAVSVCAVLAGARSDVAIAEWAQDLPVSAREVVPELVEVEVAAARPSARWLVARNSGEAVVVGGDRRCH